MLLCAVAALLAALQTFQGVEVALGQSDAGCEAIEIGSLGGGGDDALTSSGRWTGEDCDSRFFTNSDAHNYSFSLLEGGQVRVELSSGEGDSYLHLLTSDGSRIAHDDSGQGLDSRIERDLPAGDYLIEAASAVGRDSGPADFTLTVTRPTNCGPTDMGSQEAGAGLIFSGAWTGEDCGATFREDTPAQTFRFTVAEEGLVRIDLTAPVGGDPYLYLLSSDGAYLYSDDDGGQGRNSRIENDLAPGTYLIEATTHGDRDHAHELTDFDLVIRLVDPDAFHLKAETIVLPDPIVAGQPVVVHCVGRGARRRHCDHQRDRRLRPGSRDRSGGGRALATGAANAPAARDRQAARGRPCGTRRRAAQRPAHTAACSPHGGQPQRWEMVGQQRRSGGRQ